MSKYTTKVMAISAGHTPPEEKVAELMDEHKSMISFVAATQTGEGENVEQVIEIETVIGDDMPPVGDIMAQLEAYKDQECFLVFGDFPKEFVEDAEQPFPIIRADPDDKDSAAVVVALIDGNFPQYEKEGDCGAAVVAEILAGTLGRFMDAAEDMDDLMTKIMEDVAVPRMVKGLYDGRGSITLLGENGVSFTLGENKDKVEYEWGWLSHDKKPGIVEQATQAATAVVRKFGRGKPAAPDTATSKVALQSATQTHAALHQAGAEAEGGDAAYVMVQAPEGSKEEARTFYKRYNKGIVPTKFKDRPFIKILRTEKARLDKQFGLKIANVEPIRSSNVTEGSKVEVIPKAPPAEIKQHTDVFMKRPTIVKITNEGRGIVDPKRIEATEAEYAAYTEIAGLDSIYDVTVGYDNPDYLDLIQKTPHLAMILMGDMAREINKTADPAAIAPPKKDEPEVPLKATGTTGSTKTSTTPTTASGTRKFGRARK